MPSQVSQEICATLRRELDNRPLAVQRRAWEEAVADLPLPPTVTLTPQTSAGVALTPANIPTQVGAFKCAPGTMPAKYLPGSCK